MGERKGTNLYYPPDYDPKKGGLNKFLGTHALRERARKIHLGILIIRFEMPYNIWCEGCNNHIGMGVRYNAEKKKVGMYYSTPVYQFRMKCHLCDNHFEIKTDPANFDYVIVSGARRQENRWDPTQNGQVVPEDKATTRRLFDDAMFKLEHGENDQKGAKSLVPTLGKLAALREERWLDDYSANCALREKFRNAKQAQKAGETADKAVLSKWGLDFKLVPEVEHDVKLAKLLALKPSKSITENQADCRKSILNRPILPNSGKLKRKIVSTISNIQEKVRIREKIPINTGNQNDKDSKLLVCPVQEDKRIQSTEENLDNSQLINKTVVNNVINEESHGELDVSNKETISFENEKNFQFLNAEKQNASDDKLHNSTSNAAPTRNWINVSEQDSVDKKILLVSQDYLSSSDSGE